MKIEDIINLPRTAIGKYGKELATVYKELFQKDVCLSCYGDVSTMIYKLKNYYNMTQFQLLKDAYYRLEKGKAQTISNDSITDELAIKFLKLNPSRIGLFSKYPENWEELISDEPKEIQFPLEGIKGTIGDKGMDLEEYNEFKGAIGEDGPSDEGLSKATETKIEDIQIDELPEVEDEDCNCKDKSVSNSKESKKENIYDCRECLFKDLQELKVKEIQELYPEVRYKGGTKKETYMAQIADFLNLK